MNGFSCLMFIFAISVLLAGWYIFRGHDISLLLWRAPYQNLTKEQQKNLGKWTMITSIIPFLLAIMGLFWDI